MVKKPRTTLFMLMSLDGKVSMGDSDILDFDTNLSKIKGIKEGLYQYYDIEKRTDIVSFNSGRVMKKIGVNTEKNPIQNLNNVSFVLVDNKPHLTEQGIINLSQNLKKLYIITTNKNHPIYNLDIDNVKIIYYLKKINFKNAFYKLYSEYNIKRMTIQSGGTLNSILIRENLIDRISLVIAPCLVGGKDTSTIMDGISISHIKELINIKALTLQKITRLKNSYIHVVYKIL